MHMPAQAGACTGMQPKSAIFIHLFVILLVIAAGDVRHPFRVCQVPVNGQHNAFSNGVSGYQPRSFLILVGSMP